MNRSLIDRGAGIPGMVLFCVAWILASAGSLSATLREFTWKSQGRDHQLNVNIPDAVYQHYKAKRRTYDYSRYVIEDPGYTTIPAVADALMNKARSLKYSEWQTINLIAAFVQHLDYKRETGEYPRYPAETLVEGGGDCEDTSVLLAALLNYLGYDCILLSPEGHMSVGLNITGFHGQYYPYANKQYYYIETTGKNWKLGEIPSTYQGRADIYRLPNAHPRAQALTFDEQAPDPETDGKLFVSFYRSPHAAQNQYKSGEKAYEFTLRLEGDPNQLAQIKQVQYKRMHRNFPEYKANTWITRSSRHDHFAAVWTSQGTTPIKVKIYFRDGRVKDLYIDETPTVASH